MVAYVVSSSGLSSSHVPTETTSGLSLAFYKDTELRGIIIGLIVVQMVKANHALAWKGIFIHRNEGV